MEDNNMNCEACGLEFSTLYCYKVYEATRDYNCVNCYKDNHALTTEEFENEFSIERRD